MKEVVIGNSFDEIKREVRRREKAELLDAKLASLKRSAIELIKEVRNLGDLSFPDLKKGINFYQELRQFEIRLIRQALEVTCGRQVDAARLLGLKTTTLNEKIKRYGIDPYERGDEV